jgi:hypothetical protein
VDDSTFSTVSHINDPYQYRPNDYILNECLYQQYFDCRDGIPPAGEIASKSPCPEIANIFNTYVESGYIEKIPELQDIEPPKKYIRRAMHGTFNWTAGRYLSGPIATYGYANRLADGTYELTWTNAQPYCSHDKATNDCGCMIDACCEPEVVATYDGVVGKNNVTINLSAYQNMEVNSRCTFWFILYGNVLSKRIIFDYWLYYDDRAIGWISQEGKLMGVPPFIVIPGTGYDNVSYCYTFALITVCLLYGSNYTQMFDALTPEIISCQTRQPNFNPTEANLNYYNYYPNGKTESGGYKYNDKYPPCTTINWRWGAHGSDIGLAYTVGAMFGKNAATGQSYTASARFRAANPHYTDFYNTGNAIYPREYNLETGIFSYTLHVHWTDSNLYAHEEDFLAAERVKSREELLELFEECGCPNLFYEYSGDALNKMVEGLLEATVEQLFIEGYMHGFNWEFTVSFALGNYTNQS